MYVKEVSMLKKMKMRMKYFFHFIELDLPEKLKLFFLFVKYKVGLLFLIFFWCAILTIVLIARGIK